MDEADQFVYEKQAQVCDHVLAEVEKRSTENIVAESSHRLYRRISDGVRSLHVLSQHAEHDWAVDGVCILRTMYDAMLQLLWLLHNPPDRERRAEIYIGYFYIEKLRMLASQPRIADQVGLDRGVLGLDHLDHVVVGDSTLHLARQVGPPNQCSMSTHELLVGSRNSLQLLEADAR